MTRIIGIVAGALARIGAAGLLAIACMVTADVTTRYVTGRPITGVFELSGVLLVGVTFLPLALVLLTNGQLRVDILVDRLPDPLRRGMGLLDVAIGLLVFGLLTLGATEEFQKALAGKFQMRGRLGIPTWIPVAMIVTGAGAACLALLGRAATLLGLAGTQARAPGAGD